MKWPEILDADALRRTCFNVATFIDHRGGTGDGIFRYMYDRFLTEAASLTGEPRLAGMGKELTAIGDRWEEVAAVFTAAAQAENPADLLKMATTPCATLPTASRTSGNASAPWSLADTNGPRDRQRRRLAALLG